MYANLFGDFVKGRDLNHFPPLLQKGILLHREIDSYIDHHPIVLELLHTLYPKLPKVSGIAVDLFFDHLLARNWESYHQKKYDDFLSDFYTTEIAFPESYPTDFHQFLYQLKTINWMHYYPTHEGLTKACNGISKRLSFDNKLPSAPIIFNEMEPEITLTFLQFMKDAIRHFEDFHSKHQ